MLNVLCGLFGTVFSAVLGVASICNGHILLQDPAAVLETIEQ